MYLSLSLSPVKKMDEKHVESEVKGQATKTSGRTIASRWVAVLDEFKQIRLACEKHIVDAKVMDPVWTNTDELVLRWAENHKEWNEDQGGLTIAELHFVTFCYHYVATRRQDDELMDDMSYATCIKVFNDLRAAGFHPEKFDVGDLLRKTAHLIVHVLSNGLDECVGMAAEELKKTKTLADLRSEDKAQKAQRAKEPEVKYEDGKGKFAYEVATDTILLETWSLDCEAKAGKAVYTFIPMASRFFWYYWCEQLMVRDAVMEMDISDLGDGKRGDDDRVTKWLKTQFKILVLQSYRITLAELAHMNAIPMGGGSFQERGSEADEKDLPASTVAQMELPPDDYKKLNDDLEAAPNEINELPENGACEVGKMHMFMYTFDNRLKTSSNKGVPFDPYIIWKGAIPRKIKTLMEETTIWGRPQRPIIIQTQTGWFVRFLECTCVHPTTGLRIKVKDHITSVKSCVIKQRKYGFGPGLRGVTKAIECWLDIMERDFDNELPCATKITKLSKEF